MQWYFFAFLSPLLWAISNHVDKYILSKYLKSAGSGVLAIFAGLVGLMLSLGILIVSPSSIFGMSLFHAVIIISNGALLIIAFIPYYYALRDEDASLVVPLYQMIPIFSLIGGFFLLGESITLIQALGGICIIFGAVLISIDIAGAGFNLKKRVFLLMILSSFLLSVHFLVFKLIALEESFWTTVFWEYLGSVAVAIFLLLFISSYRRQFINVLKENSSGVISVNVFNEILNIGAKLVANYAGMLVPVVLVNFANGLQPMFVFLIGLAITLFLPFINKEQVSKKHIIQRIIAIIVLLFGTYLLIV